MSELQEIICLAKRLEESLRALSEYTAESISFKKPSSSVVLPGRRDYRSDAVRVIIDPSIANHLTHS